MTKYVVLGKWPAYRIGDDGTVWTRWSKNGKAMVDEWRLRATRPDKDGYPRVVLCNAEKHQMFHVHRLVAEAFHGPCPPGLEVRHFPDRDPANCRADNLKYATPKENNADKFIHGTRQIGERNGMSRIADADTPRIFDLHGKGYSHREIAAAVGLCKSQVGNILRGISRRDSHAAHLAKKGREE